MSSDRCVMFIDNATSPRLTYGKSCALYKVMGESNDRCLLTVVCRTRVIYEIHSG